MKKPKGQQIQLPITKSIHYTGVGIEVQKLPNGDRAIVVIDPASGTAHVFPLDPDAARKVGNELFSAVPIVSKMPEGAK